MSKLDVRQLKPVYEWNGVNVTHTQLDPGQEIPWHSHTEVADTFYVIAGPVKIECGDREKAEHIGAGETLRIAPGVTHRVSNPGDRMVEFLLLQGIGKYDFKPA